MVAPVLHTADCQTLEATVAATSHDVPMPTNLSAGDLILVRFITGRNSGGTTTDPDVPSGWNTLPGTIFGEEWFWRVADGTEGSTVNFAFSGGASHTAAVVSMRITGHDLPTRDIERSDVATTSATPDPPNLTPTYGSEDYLWIAFLIGTNFNSTFDVTAYPTNYTSHANLEAEVPNNGGQDYAETVNVFRQLTAASENPDSFTLAASANVIAGTLSIPPYSNALLNVPAIPSGSSVSTVTIQAQAGSGYNVTPMNVDRAIPAGFPVVIHSAQFDNLTHNNEIFSNIQADGGDLRVFLDAALTNEIPVELVTIDIGGGATDLVAWARTPTALAVNDKIYVRTTVGGGESLPASTAPNGSEAVWQDYEMVSHDLVTDSSGNLTLVPTGGAALSGADLLNLFPARGLGPTKGTALSDRVATGLTASLDPISISFITYSYTANLSGGSAYFYKSSFYRYDVQAQLRPRLRRGWSGANAGWNDNGSLADQVWEYRALVYDGSSTANDPLFRKDDNSPSFTELTAPSGTLSTITDEAYLGNDSVGSQDQDVRIGGFRIAQLAFDEAWLSLEYACYFAPETILSAEALEAGTAPGFEVPTIPAGSTTSTVTISAQSNESLNVASIASTASVSAVTLQSQNNSNLSLAAIASGALLSAITIQDQGNPGIGVPAIPSGAIVSTITLSAQSNESLNVDTIPTTVALNTPILGVPDAIVVPGLGPTATLQVVTPQGQNNESIAIVSIASTEALGALDLQAQSNESLVAPNIVSGSTVQTVTILTSTVPWDVPSIASSLLMGVATLQESGGGQLFVPSIASRLVVPAPIPRDAVLAGALPTIETNPFPPHIPAEMEEELPLEAGQFLENLTETLHDVYDRLQAGSVAFPARVLQYIDVSPRFSVGTTAKFLHEEYGFMEAEYVQFYEDGNIGVPVGISKFDPDKVTTIKDNAQNGSQFGFVAGLSAPRKATFGWVITDGWNLTPIITDSDLEEGDEIGWSATDRVAKDQPGRIIGRYFADIMVTAGATLPRGVIRIRAESSTGNRFIQELASVNSSIKQLAIVDDGLAQQITTLTTSVDSALAQIVDEKTVRADSDSALARTLLQLGVDLEGQISATLIVANQVAADGDSALVSRIEEARAEFQNELTPIKKGVASALSQVDVLASGQQLSVESVNALRVELFGTEDDDVIVVAGVINTMQADIVTNQGSITANASAITALDVRVTTAEGGITGNASAITALDTRVTTAEGNITTNASAITSVESRVTTAEGGITANASVISTHTTQITTLDGEVTDIQAEWGVTVDVNNRVKGTIRLNATGEQSTFDILANNFRVFNGSTDKAVFEASGGQVFVNGVPLNSSVSFEEGTNLRPIGVGISLGETRHGQAVNFTDNWSSPPIVFWQPGGKILTSDEQIFRALNLSSSGFTASLLLRDTGGAVTNVTDSTTSGPSGPAEIVIEKSATLEAFDDTYVYNYTVTSANPTEPDFVRFYTRTTGGGAWTERGSTQHSGTGTFNKTIAVNGLGSAAAFGIAFGGQLSGNFNQVSYTTETSPSTQSATPTGYTDVQFIIVGNPGGV